MPHPGPCASHHRLLTDVVVQSVLEIVEFPDRLTSDVVEEPLVGTVDYLSAEDFRPDIERQVREDLDVVAVVGEF